MHIPLNTPINLSDQDYNMLAQKTDGYSGADIDTIVRNALMMPIRRIVTATHFKLVSGPPPNDPTSTVIMNDLLTPCDPQGPGVMEM